MIRLWYLGALLASWFETLAPAGRPMSRDAQSANARSGSGEPPAVIAARAIELPYGRDAVGVHHVIAPRRGAVPEEWHNGAAIITTQGLHFGVHLGAQTFVEFGLGMKQQAVEPFVVPMAFIPISPSLVRQREHYVRCGARGPGYDAERLFQPYIRPIPIGRLLIHLDVETGGPCLFGEEGAHIRGPGQQRVIDRDLHR